MRGNSTVTNRISWERLLVFEVEHLLDRPGVQYAILFNPSALRSCDAVREIQEVFIIVGVRADDDMHAHLSRLAAMDVVQIEPVKIGIHFEARSRSDGFLHHFVEIQLVGIAIAEQAARRMADHADVRILHRANHACCERALSCLKPECSDATTKSNWRRSSSE